MEKGRRKPEQSPAAESNSWHIFPLDYAAMVGLLTYSSTVTATPICLVAISREMSLSLSQAGGLEAARNLLVMVTLLLSGFIGARFGKARALGWSGFVLGAGMIAYSLSPTYGILLMALALLGTGGGVFEALINPLVQELHPRDSGRYLNLTNAFWSIGVLITMLVSGELLSEAISWRAIMASLGAVSLVSGILFLALRHTGNVRSRQSLSSVLRDKRAILAAPHFWLFAAMMALAGAAEGALTYWSAALLQLHHGALPRAAGIGVALFALGMILARLGFGRWLAQGRLWQLLFVSSIAGTGISALMPLMEGVYWVYLGLFAAGVSVASFWPSLQAYAVDRMPFDPTGVFILLSCGGITGFAAMTWGMGLIGDHFGLLASFWLIPACLLALTGALLWERCLERRNGEAPR